MLRNPDRFRVDALSAAGGRVGLLAEQAAGCGSGRSPWPARTRCPRCAKRCRRSTARQPLPEILAGPDAATQLADSDCHTVLNGITGSIGLAPTLAALAAGRTLALANKESLIVGGPLVKALARPGPDHPGRLRARRALPGTGGRHARMCASSSSPRPAGRSAAVRGGTGRRTPEAALAHPTWAMGPVITMNSATLVNKGLEVIEAHLLYDIPFDRIEVVVHPQS